MKQSTDWARREGAAQARDTREQTSSRTHARAATQPQEAPAKAAGEGLARARGGAHTRLLDHLRRAGASVRRWAIPRMVLIALSVLVAAPSAAQDVVEVLRGSPLKPSGLAAGQTEFRVLFVTSTKRDASSTNIGDYNSFVQGRAGAGHSAIRPFSSKFKAVGSTSTTDARDNTSSTYTSANKGPPIYWLRGNKVADNYEDFYDGSWDEQQNVRNESGNAHADISSSRNQFIWTGSNNDGTKHERHLGILGQVRTGEMGSSSPGSPLSHSSSNGAGTRPLYGLSPLIRLINRIEITSVAISSTPGDAAKGYIEGERITIRVNFSEAMSASGAVFVPLSVGGGVERAVYASGSGTASLDFEYIVQRGDIDTNGVSLCTDTIFDRLCGNIHLNGGTLGATSDGTRPGRELPELDDQAKHKVDAAAPFVPNPNVGPEANPSMGIVPLGWSLRPTGVARGERFRLLTVTSTSRDATSAAIADYNTHVKNAAAAGHADVRAYSSGFRAVASTETVDARDNAALTGTGEKIFWLNGAQVADNYADFLDGSWDNRIAKNELGANAGSQTFVWTGSTNDGREKLGGGASFALGAAGSNGDLEIGDANSSLGGAPLSAGTATRTASRPLYGISQVLRVTEAAKLKVCIDVQSVPKQGDTYRIGETLKARYKFTEPVAVRGTPRLRMNLSSSSQVLMVYASGSGTDTLIFEYTVALGDISSPSGPGFGRTDEIIELDGADIRAVADNAPVNVGSNCATNWGRNHKVNAQRPTVRGVSVTSTPSSGGTYAAGETITVALAMNEDVRVTGAPSVMLDVGGAPRRMTYTGPIGTSTRTLSFNYTVVTADFDADGVSVCSKGRQCGAITLNGGSIRAAHGGLDANLRHPSQDAQTAHKVEGTPPSVSVSCPGERTVPSDWALKPSGISTGGKFRLMFISSGQRNAQSSNIADYNSFVQNSAGAGHSAIQPHRRSFRALASTGAVNARDNTCTTGGGTAIYWLNSSKVADNNADLYDGSWDDVGGRKHESGADSSGLIRVWTGSNADGTAAGNNGDDALGNNTVQRVTINFRDELVPAGAGPLFCGTGSTCKVIRSSTARLYGLSQVFVVGSSTTVSTGPTTTGASVISKTASAYRPGETIEIEVTFTEAVTVRGRPQLEILFGDDPLGLSGQIATYVRGSGTTKLVFSYEVTTGTPADTTGLNLSPNALRTGGTPITAVSDGVPAVYNLGDYDAILPAISVDPTAPLTGGVCARTPAIIPAIMALASQDPAGAPANCSEVTEQKLRAGIAAGGGTFDLDLHGLKLSSLKSGDFDWLNGMQTLNLSDNQLTSLPTRLFEGLNGMQTLNLRNNQLTSLPTRLFEGLNGIQTLNLGHNQLTSLPTRLFEELETLQRIQLESNQLTSLAKDTFASTPNLIEIDLRVNRLGASGLPDGIFEPLTTLLVVRLQGNPGTKSFKPMADAGEGRTVSAGETVTLSGTSTGPWGSNVTYAWRQLSATGEPVSTVELSATDVAKPTFTVPVLDEETTVKFELKLRGRGTFGPTHTSQPSEAVFTIKRLAVTGFAPASSPTTGAHFRMGETLEIAASFSDKVIVDTSGGTPRLALAIGASVGNPNRNAEYVRGSGTTELIFAYTVMRMDADNTGVSIAQNGLKANGGNITSVFGAPVPLGHAGVSNDTDLRVDWTMTPPSGGVCARTPKVRSELVTLVKESDSTVTDCSMVTATHLAGLTGTLDLSRSNVGEIRTLKQDDFEGLSALTNLEITSQTTLQRVPAGVFDPMTSLTTLRLDRNGNATDTGLSTLPPKVFDRLTRLRTLNLSDNDLATLAPRIFERLTAATQISVGSNPGTASFKPIAMAGPTGGMDAVAGTTVTLSVEGSEHGREDPWGSNVTYAWTQTEGTPVTLSNASGARPTFAAQVRTEDETLAFTVTVTGKGGTIMSTSSTQVRIATGPAITALEWVSTPRTRVNFTDYYGIGETIELGVRFERAVTVDTTGGTPSIVLELANEVRKNASYQRGSGTAQLVFGYTVKARDLGQEGVLVPANSLTLAAGTIQGATGNGAAIGHRRLDRDILHGVWGTSTEGTTESGGVCDRTTGVAAAIIANVRNREFDPLNEIGCSDIGAARLGAITGTLDVSPQATASGRMTSLKAGDFAGLTALTGLNLNDHALRIFPAGVFDPLSALTSLTISYNQTQATDSLMTLPAGLFDRLTRLRTLRLTHNDLEKLPNALFEDLVNLRTLALDSNPGTANFVPAVNSGADAEIDAQAGDTVTLDATGDVTRGPWGTNVTYAWRQASGATVTLSATNTAKPTFTAPAHADGEAQTLVLEGVVTGKGTSAADGHHATSTWTVEIAAGATTSGPATVPRAPRLVSNPKSDATYKLGETIEVEVRVHKSDNSERNTPACGNGRREHAQRQLRRKLQLARGGDTVPVHDRASRYRHGRDRDRGQRDHAQRRDDRGCGRHSSDARSRGTGDADESQGQRGAKRTDRRDLRAHHRRARRAGQAGEGEQ